MGKKAKQKGKGATFREEKAHKGEKGGACVFPLSHTYKNPPHPPPDCVKTDCVCEVAIM